MTQSRRAQYLAPATSAEVSAAFDGAVARLCEVHNFSTLDPAALLHVLTSLIAEGEARIGLAVSDARASGLSWSQIGDLLGVTRASAWQRYSDLGDAAHR